MKFILAPDKFKGSLTGLQFCEVVENSLLKVMPDSEILKLPLSDGGDGTIEILDYHLDGETVAITVSDPLFRPIQSSFLYMPAIKTAFVEMANASGMALLKKEEQNCYYTTTRGTGEAILAAIDKGSETIILGIGGSATNDCGIGMASALGYRFLDKEGHELSPTGKNLSEIYQIDTSKVDERLKNIEIKVACDVTNPLYGENGAAYVYGPQKGASPEEIEALDKGLRHIATLFKIQFNTDVQSIKGAGAAGGMGAGTTIFLNADLIPGIDLVKQLIDFDSKIKAADWIITGEGLLDLQTLSGKTIHGVITSAKAENINVAAFCGGIALDMEALKKFGIDHAAALMHEARNLEDALENTQKYLSILAEKFANKIKHT
ncbi:glycerate kinase [Gaetbulibacter aestuarii]|uniref:Glycerate kinase n=1 Tax=Gaetbulibacter aestuarii TaxID=1502358 RepID=A0ABW7MVW7_9FLAO